MELYMLPGAMACPHSMPKCIALCSHGPCYNIRHLLITSDDCPLNLVIRYLQSIRSPRVARA